MASRRFEYRDHKSSKFWEIEQRGQDLTTTWGRIGTAGQTKTKAFTSEAKAAAELDKQIRSKTGKGYVEVGGAAGAAGSTATATVTAAPSTVIADGGEVTVKGSSSRTYQLRNVGGVYSCTCPAWRNQSAPIDRRTCKHLRGFRGEAAEQARLGALPQPATPRTPADAPPLLLAHRWEEQDPTGWWMSEKLDGVRAYWTGDGFVSRLGNSFFAPDWFVEGLPEFPLDGELFGGRGQFQHTVSVARRADGGDAWRSLEFVIFDAPAVDARFEDRLAHLDDHFGRRPWELARVLEHRTCAGVEDLRTELARVEGLGGEGVMLRRPGSRYVAGRSETLLKVKSFFDTEARVVGHQAGSGRHKGRLGALLVELADGTGFKVGTGLSDAERERPPAIGEVVTVRYQELTNAGVPRFPTYLGARVDVDWDAAVAKAKAQAKPTSD